jgi:NAD(P)H dehydrogenase (quinone)
MILVTGATGSIGTHLAQQLSADGAAVKALVRDPAKGAALGVDHVVGDFDSPDSVKAALTNVDQLFLNGTGAVPVSGEQPMIRHHRDLIDAAKAAGVRRVVKISVWHAHPKGRLSQGIHGILDEHLRSSGMDSTILSPSAFMQNYLRGGLDSGGALVGPLTDPHVSYIDAYDIARVAAALLTDKAPFGGDHVLTGPEAISHTRIAAELSAVMNRRVRYVGVSPAEMTARMVEGGLPADFAADVVHLWQGMADGDSSEVTDAVVELTGTPPRSFSEFVAANRHIFESMM